MNRDRRLAGGFTLVEVLVTLVTASLLLTAVYGAFLGSLSAKRTCEESARVYRLGQGILTLLRRDLTGAFAPEDTALEGVSGTAQGGSADRIEFITTSDARRAIDGKGSDICEVGYRAEPDPETPGLLQLLRREGHGIQGSAFQGGTLEFLAAGVSSFQLEYLGGDGNWIPEWQVEGLPVAVRVILVLREETAEGQWGREVTFRTLIPLPSGGASAE
ncbi:MAG: prepilin-type N-terminal cleavage/methylation domain-containing protein [Planctomycetota bacterium]|jgi:general secretion pathway protein J